MIRMFILLNEMQTHYEQQYVSKEGVIVEVPAYYKVSMTKRDHEAARPLITPYGDR